MAAFGGGYLPSTVQRAGADVSFVPEIFSPAQHDLLVFFTRHGFFSLSEAMGGAGARPHMPQARIGGGARPPRVRGDPL